MRPVTEMTNSIVRMQYPLPQSDGSAPPAGAAPPLRLSYVIPPTVVLPPKIEAVGHWDPEVCAARL